MKLENLNMKKMSKKQMDAKKGLSPTTKMTKKSKDAYEKNKKDYIARKK